MAHSLYPHQEAATQATFDFFEENPTGHPLVVAPVAAGKSLLIAEFIRRASSIYPFTTFLVLSHVSKLLTQDAKELKGQWPEASYCFYADKLDEKRFDAQTIFASIQSIYKKAYLIPHRIDIILVDEAHLISPNDDTMYQAFIRDMLVINPYLKVIGYTGTNFRATEGRLTEGDNRIFTDIAYQIPMLYLIEKGFLCPLVTPPTKTRMSTEGVKSSNGDYIEKQLQAAVDVDYITKACVDEIIEHGATRKKWLGFTAGKKHCKNVMEEIRSRGISCEMLTSDNDNDEEELYKAFERGDFQCLVTVGKATTGVNVPAIDLIFFMRPTRSPVLYVQMGGRGMRLFPGKTDCCLLDFGGVIAELGPVDLVDAKRVEGSGNGEAPIKICPNEKCGAVCFAGVRECPDCGFKFPVTTKALSIKPSDAAVLSHQIEPEWHEVRSINYLRHAKEGKIASLCVAYNTIYGPFREWVCYEHTGFAREKACRWHKKRSNEPVPKKIEDALKLRFKEPKRICTRKAGKYHEIIAFDFGETND